MSKTLFYKSPLWGPLQAFWGGQSWAATALCIPVLFPCLHSGLPTFLFLESPLDLTRVTISDSSQSHLFHKVS